MAHDLSHVFPTHVSRPYTHPQVVRGDNASARQHDSVIEPVRILRQGRIDEVACPGRAPQDRVTRHIVEKEIGLVVGIRPQPKTCPSREILRLQLAFAPNCLPSEEVSYTSLHQRSKLIFPGQLLAQLCAPSGGPVTGARPDTNVIIRRHITDVTKAVEPAHGDPVKRRAIEAQVDRTRDDQRAKR